MRALVFSHRLRRPPRTSSSFLPAPHQMGAFMTRNAPTCRRGLHDNSERKPSLSVYGHPSSDRTNYRPSSATTGRISDGPPSHHSRPPPP